MLDMEAFSVAQKMVWAKHFLDPEYVNTWKSLEIKTLSHFHEDWIVFWKTSAPKCVLNSFKNSQLAETLCVWYLYRDKIKDNLGFKDFFLQDPIWWNKNIHLKRKRYFYYPDWLDKGITYLSDLDMGHNFIKTFEDLVLEYDISIRDRRKFNSLMNGILLDWFYNPKQNVMNIFDEIVSDLIKVSKVPKQVYSVLKVQDNPIDAENYWFDVLCDDEDEDIDWADIHNNNFTCSVETHLKSFYFKIFHKAICTNKFLHKIGKIDSPNCCFCDKMPESLVHLFCDCEIITPLWDKLCGFIFSKSGEQLTLSKFEQMFGVNSIKTNHWMIINYLVLYLKFYIHRCKFQKVDPNFSAFLNLVKIKFNTEYKIAEKNKKLGKHFKKFSFDLSDK